MRIQVQKLRTLLELLEPGTQHKKVTIKACAHILAQDGWLTANNLETEISIKCPEAVEPMLIPVGTILEALKPVPGFDTVELTNVKKNVIGMLRQMVKGTFYVDAEPADFPRVQLGTVRSEGAIDAVDALLTAAKTAMYYCAADDSRPVLHGVNIKLGEVTQIAGADSYRMSLQTIKEDYPVSESITIDQEPLKLLCRLWDKHPGPPRSGGGIMDIISIRRPINLTLYGGGAEADKAVIKYGDVIFTTQLVVGTFPDVLQLVPKLSESVHIEFMAAELQSAAQQVSSTATGTGIVRLEWVNKTLTVSTKSEEVGTMEVSLPLLNASADGKIAVNSKYLLDYLRDKSGVITMYTTVPSSPMAFKAASGPLVIVMPMFVQWESPAKEEVPVEDIHENIAVEPESQTEETEDNADQPEETESEDGEPEEPEVEPVAEVKPAATMEAVPAGNDDLADLEIDTSNL